MTGRAALALLTAALLLGACTERILLYGTPDAAVRDSSLPVLDAATPDAIGDATPPPEAGLPDAGPCRGAAEGCLDNTDCCSGICREDPSQPARCADPSGCLPEGSACTFAMQCCAMACVEGLCAAAPLCLTNGDACTANAQCCSHRCDVDRCKHLADCRTAGDDCANDGECCSGSCVDLGGPKKQCELLPLCRVLGELCVDHLDCCSGHCILSPQGVPRCAAAPSAPGACMSANDRCQDSADCCSGLCSDVDSTARRCQLSSGCRAEGELCSGSGQCCSSQCTADPEGVFRCVSSHGCLGLGEPCVGDALCCDPSPGACREDQRGVRRCLGDPAAQCASLGAGCTTTDQCCSGLCLEGLGGGLACAYDACLGPGQACTGGNQCCDESVCRVIWGEPRCVP